VPLDVEEFDADLVGFTLMPSFSAQQIAYKCDTNPSSRMIFDKRGVSVEQTKWSDYEVKYSIWNLRIINVLINASNPYTVNFKLYLMSAT
jgi:hypothetical protein